MSLKGAIKKFTCAVCGKDGEVSLYAKTPDTCETDKCKNEHAPFNPRDLVGDNPPNPVIVSNDDHMGIGSKTDYPDSHTNEYNRDIYNEVIKLRTGTWTGKLAKSLVAPNICYFPNWAFKALGWKNCTEVEIVVDATNDQIIVKRR